MGRAGAWAVNTGHDTICGEKSSRAFMLSRTGNPRHPSTAGAAALGHVLKGLGG